MPSHSLLPSSHIDTYVREQLPPEDQWPEFIFDRPELPYPALLNVTSELVDVHVAHGHGNRPALHGHDGEAPFTWTYPNFKTGWTASPMC